MTKHLSTILSMKLSTILLSIVFLGTICVNSDPDLMDGFGKGVHTEVCTANEGSMNPH